MNECEADPGDCKPCLPAIQDEVEPLLVLSTRVAWTEVEQANFPMHVHLANALGLRPLDRVQVNDRAARDAYWLDARQGPAELPFWYFQMVTADGLLELASPSGHLVRVRPTDVCDVRRAEPVLVQAMPKAVFTERCKMTLAQRQGVIPPECFAPAHVLRVSKDRWNRVDSVFVQFLDTELNCAGAWAAPLQDGERQRLQGIAKRTRMPVQGAGHGNYSADSGLDRERDYCELVAGTFVRAALRGRTGLVDRLASISASAPMTRAQINRAWSDAARQA